jgi:hypothetical protein
MKPGVQQVMGSSPIATDGVVVPRPASSIRERRDETTPLLPCPANREGSRASRLPPMPMHGITASLAAACHYSISNILDNMTTVLSGKCYCAT